MKAAMCVRLNCCHEALWLASQQVFSLTSRSFSTSQKEATGPLWSIKLQWFHVSLLNQNRYRFVLECFFCPRKSVSRPDKETAPWLELQWETTRACLRERSNFSSLLRPLKGLNGTRVDSIWFVCHFCRMSELLKPVWIDLTLQPAHRTWTSFISRFQSKISEFCHRATQPSPTPKTGLDDSR